MVKFVDKIVVRVLVSCFLFLLCLYLLSSSGFLSQPKLVLTIFISIERSYFVSRLTFYSIAFTYLCLSIPFPSKYCCNVFSSSWLHLVKIVHIINIFENINSRILDFYFIIFCILKNPFMLKFLFIFFLWILKISFFVFPTVSFINIPIRKTLSLYIWTLD